MSRKLSLNKKLIIGFILAGLIPALVITLVIARTINSALTSEAEKKLISVREAKAFQLEELYATMAGQISAMSQNTATIEATEQFIEAFYKYPSESPKQPGDARRTLKPFYEGTFGDQYKETNLGNAGTKHSDILHNLNDNEALLQDAFISSNPNPLGSKDNLSHLNNESTYSKTHKNYHPTFRTFLNKFGFYDIFIVNPKDGRIVYSVFKELDYATNIKDGPYANSGIGQAFHLATGGAEPEGTYFTDIAKYYPSYDAPAQFLSTKIQKNGTTVGILIFQIPLGKIDTILTSNKQWEERGSGKSGETYLIGSDQRMRSISRFIAEDPNGFFEVMNSIGVSKENIDYMKAKQTSALATSVNTIGATNVINGQTGFAVFPDYRGVNVISAYRPLKIPGVDWFILSEMDESEALESLEATLKIISAVILFSGIFILLFAVAFSKAVSKNLVEIATKIKESAENVLASSNNIANSSNALSASTEEQSQALRQSSASTEEISSMVEKSCDYAKSTTLLSEKSKQISASGKIKIDEVKSRIEDIHRENQELARVVETNNKDFENIIQIISDISQKTEVINDIVFQTKLLSFNASVEAARAGEQGKGFAVVAEEVGALAVMSGDAAKDIGDLLTQSKVQVEKTVENSMNQMNLVIEKGKKSVEEGLSDIHECSNTLNEIVNSFSEVSQSVNEIASSSEEQSTGVKEINEAIHHMDSVTRQNSQIAAQTSKDAQDMNEYSSKLTGIVSHLQEIIFGNNKALNQDHGIKRELTPKENIVVKFPEENAIDSKEKRNIA